MFTLEKQYNFISLLLLSWTLLMLISCNNNETAPTTISNNKQIVTNDSEQITRIRMFLSMLHNNPTLVDYQTVMGYSDYAEFQFYLKECGETNNIKAPLVNNKCHHNMILNWQEKKSSKSHYLMWLSDKIPDRKFTVTSVVTVDSDNDINGQQVTINMEGKRILFWLANTSVNIRKYGELKVLSINDVPISLLREHDSIGSIIIATGLKNLVRPYTKAELADIKQQYQKDCESDSECFKISEEDKKDQAIELEESKIANEINSRYVTWCKRNKILCSEQEKETFSINKQLVTIEKNCKKNSNACELNVKKWSKVFMARKDYYCQSYADDCKKISEIENSARRRMKEKCVQKPELCEKMSAFQQALMSIDDN